MGSEAPSRGLRFWRSIFVYLVLATLLCVAAADPCKPGTTEILGIDPPQFIGRAPRQARITGCSLRPDGLVSTEITLNGVACALREVSSGVIVCDPAVDPSLSGIGDIVVTQRGASGVPVTTVLRSAVEIVQPRLRSVYPSAAPLRLASTVQLNVYELPLGPAAGKEGYSFRAGGQPLVVLSWGADFALVEVPSMVSSPTGQDFVDVVMYANGTTIATAVGALELVRPLVPGEPTILSVSPPYVSSACHVASSRDIVIRGVNLGQATQAAVRQPITVLIECRNLRVIAPDTLQCSLLCPLRKGNSGGVFPADSGQFVLYDSAGARLATYPFTVHKEVFLVDRGPYTYLPSNLWRENFTVALYGDAAANALVLTHDTGISAGGRIIRNFTWEVVQLPRRVVDSGRHIVPFLQMLDPTSDSANDGGGVVVETEGSGVQSFAASLRASRAGAGDAGEESCPRWRGGRRMSRIPPATSAASAGVTEVWALQRAAAAAATMSPAFNAAADADAAEAVRARVGTDLRSGAAGAGAAGTGRTGLGEELVSFTILSFPAPRCMISTCQLPLFGLIHIVNEFGGPVTATLLPYTSYYDLTFTITPPQFAPNLVVVPGWGQQWAAETDVALEVNSPSRLGADYLPHFRVASVELASPSGYAFKAGAPSGTIIPVVLSCRDPSTDGEDTLVNMPRRDLPFCDQTHATVRVTTEPGAFPISANYSLPLTLNTGAMGGLQIFFKGPVSSLGNLTDLAQAVFASVRSAVELADPSRIRVRFADYHKKKDNPEPDRDDGMGYADVRLLPLPHSFRPEAPASLFAAAFDTSLVVPPLNASHVGKVYAMHRCGDLQYQRNCNTRNGRANVYVWVYTLVAVIIAVVWLMSCICCCVRWRCEKPTLLESSR